MIVLGEMRLGHLAPHHSRISSGQRRDIRETTYIGRFFGNAVTRLHRAALTSSRVPSMRPARPLLGIAPGFPAFPNAVIHVIRPRTVGLDVVEDGIAVSSAKTDHSLSAPDDELRLSRLAQRGGSPFCEVSFEFPSMAAAGRGSLSTASRTLARNQASCAQGPQRSARTGAHLRWPVRVSRLRTASEDGDPHLLQDFRGTFFYSGVDPGLDQGIGRLW